MERYTLRLKPPTNISIRKAIRLHRSIVITLPTSFLRDNHIQMGNELTVTHIGRFLYIEVPIKDLL